MKTLLYENTLFGKIPCGITNGNLSLVVSTASTVDPLVEKYHYSHKATSNRFLSFLVKKQDKVMGFLQLGYGIRPHIKHAISTKITKTNYCEFDRMWLSDELPKFSESQTIALLLSYLRQVHKNIHFVITYADGSAGNTGTIYKATNAIQLEPINVDFYLLPDGERVHPVSMWHRHKTRKWKTLQEIYPGIKHLTQEKQFRFVYTINKKDKIRQNTFSR